MATTPSHDGGRRPLAVRGMSWGAMLVVFVALFLLAGQLIKRSGAYTTAEAFLFDHPEVQRRVGPNVRGDLLPTGNVRTTGERGRASFEIGLKGDRGEATAAMELIREQGDWRVVRADLSDADGGQVLDLFDPAAVSAAPGPVRSPATPEQQLAALREAVAANPDDFEVHRQLDHALFQQRRLEEIVPIWNTYLLRHPDDGRAWLERGGTWYHLKDYDRAHQDARRACELGVRDGCGRAQQLERLLTP